MPLFLQARCLILINFLAIKAEKTSKKTDEKLKSLQEKWNNINVYLRNNKTLLYLTPTAFFVVAMLCVFAHGIIVNNNAGFEVIQINEPQPFATYEVTVTAISFNPDEAIHRMDVFLDTTAHSADLFNYQLDVSAVALIDPSHSLDVEIVRVTSQFFVIYIRDLPVGFGAIRKDITYFTGDYRSASLSIRTEESQSLIDYGLEIEMDSLELMSYTLANDIRILELQVAEFEYEIEELEYQIATNFSHIEQLESDLTFQVGEQLATSQSRIQVLLNQNSNLQNDIEELENDIEEAQNHIELITETIKNL